MFEVLLNYLVKAISLAPCFWSAFIHQQDVTWQFISISYFVLHCCTSRKWFDVEDYVKPCWFNYLVAALADHFGRMTSWPLYMLQSLCVSYFLQLSVISGGEQTRLQRGFISILGHCFLGLNSAQIWILTWPCFWKRTCCSDRCISKDHQHTY